MNDKQKEIEEMAKALDAIEAIMWENAAYDTSDMAKSFYNAGYRNCKDKAVLTKEEQDKILQATQKRIEQLKKERNDYKQRYESAEKRYEQLVQSSCEFLEKKGKETAREIIEYLRDNGRKYEVWYLISELRKQYGVEVE